MPVNERQRRYDVENIPFNESLEQFAPPYTPEQFTGEEQRYLQPFFSNTDRPVFVIHNLPEEVIAALSSRYSRSELSLRRLFLSEYVGPILDPHPEKDADWEKLDKDGKAQRVQEAQETKESFVSWINFFHEHGGMEKVVNVQRARKFFSTWLGGYGDESISEMGNAHVCLEGISNVATNEVEGKRVGVSPIEKSSRFVSFAERRPDGEFHYIVPVEIRGTDLEADYREAMDLLFATYVEISEPYLEYIKGRYPKGEDETTSSFNSSRSAKRFDDTRDLLPFSTQTNVALSGNGRAYEDLINRLLSHPLGEIRWWGKAIGEELNKVVPSFIERSQTVRGSQLQRYRDNLRILKGEIAEDKIGHGEFFPERWVSLVSSTPEPDIEVLSAFLFSESSGLSLDEVRAIVKYDMTPKERAEQFNLIFEERKLREEFTDVADQRTRARFRKVPRSFETARFMFGLWARGGDYRDLHRHRVATQERQKFTTQWGFDLEREVEESIFIGQVKLALEKAADIHRRIADQISPDVAQYAVPFGAIQHWYMELTAREIYWMVEIRTGSQGRPHYREICQQIADQVWKVSPALFAGLLTDRNDYSMARRESERKAEAKRTQLGIKSE
ncbi:FAD-dependent thymidylate synthase [Candidatus Microgenomates bacterium]|nr:FAD-dependent thymidylate synthase [Candidatus Microgenomates bacterium]